MNALDVGVAVHESELALADAVDCVSHDALIGMPAGKALLDNGHLTLPDHVDRYLEVRIVGPSAGAIRAERVFPGHVGRILESLAVQEIENSLVVSESRAREAVWKPVPITKLLECPTEESLESVISTRLIHERSGSEVT